MLLQTKLHIPQPRGDTLLRPRLVDLLKAGLDKPLILLSAPAGYGKTTLLAQFTAETPVPVAWYQLDASDNDPAVFFEYLVESFAGRFPEFGATTRSLLQSSENIAAEWQRFLVVFINEMVDTVAEDGLVVLEEYHVIDNSLIHGVVDRLLSQAPPQLHLLLSTRSDPLISLARLRARRQIAEIRGHDLRFTSDEARAFINQVADLDLPAQSTQTLVEATEGWAAALQLALSSPLRSQGDSTQAFIEAFRGTSRYLFDYLSEEVLAAQTVEVRSFLLSSSILERMTSRQCDELLGVSNSREILQSLEAQNLFTVALDDHREWYRYHHLFRDFLQEQLGRQRGDDEVRALHLRAVASFEASGDIDQAIYHAVAAGAREKLADLVEQAAPIHLGRGRLRTVQRWLDAVPDEVLAGRPWLALYRGMILATQGQPHEARPHLSQARQAYTVAGDELGESRALNQLSRVAILEGRYEESLELNHEALQLMPWTDHEGRTQALRDQCELWMYLGSSVQAVRAAKESLAHARHLGDRAVVAERTIMQGVAYSLAGRLLEAMRTLKRGLRMLGTPDALGAHYAHSHLGESHFERWELDRAIEHYQQCLALSQKFQDSTVAIAAHCTLGITYAAREAFDASTTLSTGQAQTHFDAALAILEQTGMRSLLAEMTWSYLAEWHVKAGRYTQAEACSRKAIAIRSANGKPNSVWHALGRDESSGLAWGTGWLPLAKVYLATGRLDEAEKILLDVEAASETGGISHSFLDSAFHLGWLYLETGREEEAISHIRRALSAAAPEGQRWVFLAHEREAAPVLVHALKHKIEPAFVQALLRELGEAAELRPEAQHEGSALTELLAHSDAEVRRYARELLVPEPLQHVETAATAAPAAPLHVTCFGDFKVTHGGQEVGEPGWLATKAGDLFAYFITFRDANVSRDRVLEALWPEVAPERSSGAFHTALYKMRQVLRSGSPGKFVRARSGEYYLEKEVFWIDADEFTMLNAHCSRHPHESLEHCEACVERLKRAVNLYQGDYLENLYYDWALDEQRHLQAIYLKALGVLAKHHAGRGEYETAIAYGRQMLDKDPLLEDVHCPVMRYHGRLGDRNGLMRQYRRLEEILADELGVDPMPETQELYRALMEG